MRYMNRGAAFVGSIWGVRWKSLSVVAGEHELGGAMLNAVNQYLEAGLAQPGTMWTHLFMHVSKERSGERDRMLRRGRESSGTSG